mgnify:CR=1 FL=1
MKKRIASLFLVLAMALTLLPTAVMAEENSNVDTWDGTADTSWYTSAPDASEYLISTAEQLAGLAQLVNADPGTTNFAGKTFYLENDLDLSGHEWISIGTGRGGTQSKYSFCGVFDGQGHVISNLYSHESYIDGADESHNLLRNALFGNVYNGEVKNLGVENAEIWIDPLDDSAAGKGILVDWLGKSKITNCWTSGSIESGSKIEKNIGGIVGVTVQGCTISGCYSTATLTGNFTNSKGFYTEPNPADWPFDTIGGIVGARFDGNLTVTDCWFDGKIVVNSITAAVGGIVGCIATVNNSVGGSVGDADIATKNCMVTTTDMGVDKDGNTCWVAYALDGTVENCYWPNDTKYRPSPLEADQGTPVSDFTSAGVLTGLQTNASKDVKWVAGIDHPTFKWDERHISADYTAVDAALAKVPEDLTGYTDSSVAALKDAINAVVRGKNITEQDEVDAMAKAIEDAVAALELKPTPRPSRPSSPSYGVSAPATDNGTVSVSPKNASAGTTVTVTVKPDSGYVLGGLRVTDKNGDDVKLTDQGNGKYTFAMPAGGAEVSADFVKETKENPFTDVPSGAYYYDAVLWAVENGVTDGVTATLFAPDASCTRAQIVTFLWRAAGSPEPVGTSAFTDVPASAYYTKAVAWAVENGITTGTSDTTFSPDAPCTRGQSVTFLYRARKGAASASTIFTDVPAGAFYAAPVAWAVENGITNGTSTATFSPDAPCTRAEIVTFLYRAK